MSSFQELKIFWSHLLVCADAARLAASVEDFTHVSGNIVSGKHSLHVETCGAGQATLEGGEGREGGRESKSGTYNLYPKGL